MRPGSRSPSPGERLLESVQRAARAVFASSPVSIHLKVDTGLRRYGATASEAVALAVRIAGDPQLRLAGVYTHFASADEPDEPFTADQLREFDHVVDSMRGAGVRLPPLHAANSAGILTGHGTDYAVARAGIALYGVPPSSAVPLLPGMRAGMSIESRITRLIALAPGRHRWIQQDVSRQFADARRLGANWIRRRLPARAIRTSLGRY